MSTRAVNPLLLDPPQFFASFAQFTRADARQLIQTRKKSGEFAGREGKKKSSVSEMRKRERVVTVPSWSDVEAST